MLHLASMLLLRLSVLITMFPRVLINAHTQHRSSSSSFFFFFFFFFFGKICMYTYFTEFLLPPLSFLFLELVLSSQKQTKDIPITNINVISIKI